MILIFKEALGSQSIFSYSSSCVEEIQANECKKANVATSFLGHVVEGSEGYYM